MKIEKNRPLPSHTKLDYDECYVKIILEKFFPDIYGSLQLSDRPDLRDVKNSVGIEVTSAIPRGEQEALSLASEIPYLSSEKQEKRIAYLEKKGYKYTKYMMIHPGRSYRWTGSDNPDIEITFCKDFLYAVTKKIDKLNSGNYAPMKRYDLFVISGIFIEEWMPEKLMEKLVSYKTKAINYSFIYLLALNGIFVFNMDTERWTFKDTKEKTHGLGELARQIVEDGEEDKK